jgi:polyketide biosynthesis 3-hydroxy-3-methylglutaryl-CoA synthase-like enzyme PksG
VGNLCSGSVYLALASLIDHAQLLEGARVGLYSYGSGCSAELFSGVIDARSRQALAQTGVREHLDSRALADFAEYDQLITESRDVLVPQAHRQVEVDRYLPYLERYRQERQLLVFTGTKDYGRTYEWVTAGRAQARRSA